MKKSILVLFVVLCCATSVFAVSASGIYDTSWKCNALKYDASLSEQFREATYEIEFDDDYSFSLEADYELKRNASVSSGNDVLSYFIDVFSEFNTFEIKGFYDLTPEGDIAVFDRFDNPLFNLQVSRKNRVLTVQFPDGTVLDFRKD